MRPHKFEPLRVIRIQHPARAYIEYKTLLGKNHTNDQSYSTVYITTSQRSQSATKHNSMFCIRELANEWYDNDNEHCPVYARNEGCP